MKRSKRTALSHARTTKRAAALIDTLLKEMQRGLSEPALLESPEWEKLFGPKQSVVVNALKLVQALAALPCEVQAKPTKEPPPPEGERLSDEEMRMLTEWLAQGRVSEE